MSKRDKRIKHRGARGLGPVRGGNVPPPPAKPGQFGEGLPFGAWLLRMVTTGLALVAAGAAFGGICGLILGSQLGGMVALPIVAIAGIFWGFVRTGGAGFGLGIVGGFAGMLGASEIRHFVVTRGEVAPIGSLANWDPTSGPSRLRFEPVVAADRFSAHHTKTYRGSKGGSTTIGYRAIPWTEAGRVVGFGCIVSSHKGRSAMAGAFGLAASSWDGEREEMCAKAIETSETWARRAGVEVAPNAASRVVRVYGSEAELRDDHDASKALWGPGIFLAVYVAGAAVFRLVQQRKAAARAVR